MGVTQIKLAIVGFRENGIDVYEAKIEDFEHKNLINVDLIKGRGKTAKEAVDDFKRAFGWYVMTFVSIYESLSEFNFDDVEEQENISAKSKH
jgi:hypothetical protein